MRVLAISGSYRKHQAVETLIDHALEGVKTRHPAAQIEKINLVDRHIEYCRNCMACRDDDPAKPYARCVINDDMQELYPKVAAADALLLGTPVNMAEMTALMKTFLERLCWVMATPGRWPLRGCPRPRCTRQRRAALIVTSGVVPPLLRRWCDLATPQLAGFCRWDLNARVVARMYAGAIWKRGVDYYIKQAYALGQQLAGPA